MDEDAASADHVHGAFQAEEKQIARLQARERLTTAGLPEIHLIDVGAPAEEVEPLEIGRIDVEVHDTLSPSASGRRLCRPTVSRIAWVLSRSWTNSGSVGTSKLSRSAFPAHWSCGESEES